MIRWNATLAPLLTLAALLALPLGCGSGAPRAKTSAASDSVARAPRAGGAAAGDKTARTTSAAPAATAGASAGVARVRKKLIEFGWDEPDPAFMRRHVREM